MGLQKWKTYSHLGLGSLSGGDLNEIKDFVGDKNF
jgi:hypothetical protein